MAKPLTGPKYYPSRKSYFVKINGKQINLGKDKRLAEIKFHDLVGELIASGEVPEQADNSDTVLHTVADVFELYLRYVVRTRAETTYKAKKDYLNLFLEENPQHSVRNAEKLLPIHLTDWCNRHETWGPTYSHTIISAIQTAFNWAIREKIISVNQLKGMEKPSPQGKAVDDYLSNEDYKKILAAIEKDDPFRDLVIFLWETGCRPQELFRLEHRHIDRRNQRVIMDNVKAKGPKIRIIVLTDEAMKAIERQSSESGIVFRNTIGNPWDKGSVNCRFRRLAKKTGVKTSAYRFRHGFATDLLENKVDAVQVLTLMGHKDTRMVSSTYSHLLDKTDALRASMKQRDRDEN